MNDTFSISRFLLVLTDQFRVYGRRFVVLLLAGLGFLAAPTLSQALVSYSYKVNMGFDPMIDLMITFYWLGLFVIGMLAGGMTCSNLKTKEDRIAVLTLPASQLEIFIARWLIMVPIFIVAYTLGYEILDLLRGLIVTVRFPDTQSYQFLGLKMFSENTDYGVLLALYFTLQSFFVLGGAIWPGRAFLHTSLWLAGLSFLIAMWTTMWGTALLWGRNVNHIVVNNTWDLDGLTMLYLLCLVACLLNYTLAYLRLKELEIVNRW